MLQKPGKNPDGQTVSRFRAEFASLASPVIGRKAAEDLCYRTLERYEPGPALQKLGAMAAFFAEEFEDTQSLDKKDLEDIRQILE
jgi:hypothetical protein